MDGHDTTLCRANRARRTIFRIGTSRRRDLIAIQHVRLCWSDGAVTYPSLAASFNNVGIIGSSFSQLVASAGYTFNPSSGNTATISLPSGTTAQYVELSFTGNTGWPAAQLSEFEVFP